MQDIPNVGGKVIVGDAVAITEQTVQLKDGREVPYDHLVFAVGSLNGEKGTDVTLQDRKNTLKVGSDCACPMPLLARRLEPSCTTARPPCSPHCQALHSLQVASSNAQCFLVTLLCK